MILSEQPNSNTGVTMSLGLMSATFDLATIRKPNAGTATSGNKEVCGTCETPTPVKKQAVCEHGHVGPPRKARPVGDQLVFVTKEEIQQVKDAGSPEKLLELHVCPAAELEAATRPDAAQYRVRLPKAKGSDPRFYALFLRLAASPGLALYGIARLSGTSTPRPYRLQVWNGQLILQGLIPPHEVAAMDEEIPSECADNLVQMGVEFMTRIARPFESSLLVDQREGMLDSLVAAKLGATPVPVVPVPEPDVISIEALLAEALRSAETAAAS